MNISPEVQKDAQQALAKLKALLTSRRFWALVTALVAIIAGLSTGQISTAQAVTDAAGALAAYMLAVGVGG